MDDLAVDGIVKTIQAKNINLVVMGTSGVGAIQEVFFGSNTERVIEKAQCPVIAVPEGVSLQPCKRITYATNYNKADLEVLKQLAEIAGLNRSQINLVHIADNEDTEEKEKKKMDTLVTQVKKEVPYNQFSFQLIFGNREKTFRQYLEKQSTDLLVMATRRRNGLSKLFDKSFTRKMVHKTKIPVMAFHY